MAVDSWGGWAIGAASLIGSVGVPIYFARTRKHLDEVQAEALERQKADAARNQIADDDRRNDELRRMWRYATEDLDDLWTFLENEMLPWARTTYQRVQENDLANIGPPPKLPRRRARTRFSEE